MKISTEKKKKKKLKKMEIPKTKKKPSGKRKEPVESWKLRPERGESRVELASERTR